MLTVITASVQYNLLALLLLCNVYWPLCCCTMFTDCFVAMQCLLTSLLLCNGCWPLCCCCAMFTDPFIAMQYLLTPLVIWNGCWMLYCCIIFIAPFAVIHCLDCQIIFIGMDLPCHVQYVNTTLMNIMLTINSSLWTI